MTYDVHQEHREQAHRFAANPACGLCTKELRAQAAEMEAALDTKPATVQRVDLFGNMTDTFQTEAELNGHKASQGRLI